MKPRIFLGGASESDRLVRALGKKLQTHAVVQSWRNAFPPGVSTLESLRRAATDVDFAVFVWGRDDLTVSRRKAKPSPRDNVVYEAGLFAGHLGHDRTFIIHASDTKLPTDYVGVTTIPLTSVDRIGDQIAQAILRKGRRALARLVGYWWQVVTSGRGPSVLSLFEIVVAADTRVVSIAGQSWNSKGRQITEWHCPAAAFDEARMRLHYSWEGLHTTEAGMPLFFGVGEVDFSREPFTGSFSSTPRNLHARPTLLRRARYFRALPSDPGIVSGADRIARTRLIQQRLKSRAALADS